jgi:hypothetical protein
LQLPIQLILYCPAQLLGCTGVFILTMPTQTLGLELKHAKNIIAASKAAGIKRAACSTATRAEENENFAFVVEGNPLMKTYWLSKKNVQAAVQAAGFESWTILQPVSAFYFKELKEEKVLASSFVEDTKIRLTDPEDIGSFAVQTFTEKEGELKGEIVKFASEGLTTGVC